MQGCCPRLEIVFLHNNRIGAVPDDLASAGGALQTLRLDNNRVEHVGGTALQKCHALVSLDLRCAPEARVRPSVWPLLLLWLLLLWLLLWWWLLLLLLLVLLLLLLLSSWLFVLTSKHACGLCWRAGMHSARACLRVV
jgi:hypothetical protein